MTTIIELSKNDIRNKEIIRGYVQRILSLIKAESVINIDNVTITEVFNVIRYN